MKTSFFLLTFLTFNVIAFSGELNPEVESFHKIKILGNFQINAHKSDKESIKIVNNDPDVEDDKILAEVKNGELEIKIKGDNFKEHKIEVTIYYKEISGVDIRRGAWIKFEETVAADSLTLEVASGGHIVAPLKCRSIYAAVSKGGSIKIEGSSQRAEYNVFAGGEIYALKLQSETIVGKIRTGGDITVTAGKNLDVLIFSGGKFMYKGEPENFTKEIKIAGDIKKLDK